MLEVIERMIGRGSTVTKAEALSVLEEYEAAVADILRDGEAIVTPLFKITPHISGVFVDETDTFESPRHTVQLSVNPGIRIAPIASTIKVQKVAATTPQPQPKTFKDISSQTRNEIITAGGVGELNGGMLKLNTQDPEQGVFFIAEDGTETKAGRIIRNKPANLIFTIPDDLTPGSYEVEVRAILRGTKTMRKGRLAAPLNVIAHTE